MLNRKGNAMWNPMTHDALPQARELMDAANRHIQAGRTESALPIYEKLVQVLPDHPDLHHTLGLAYLETGHIDLAVTHMGRSVELNPQNDVAYRGLGDALVAADQIPLAIRSYQRSNDLNPGNADALLHLGNLFHELAMYERAEEAFSRILSGSPHHQQGMNNLAKLYHDMGRLEPALDLYDRCLAQNPQYAEAQFNRAALLLAMGDYRRGWEAYEWRFRRANAASAYPHRLSTPRWQGEEFKDRRLLVHCEQGMGDVLQFMRYLPMVKALGGDVTLEAHEPLVPLLERQAGVDAVIPFNPNRPPDLRHDLHVPMLSLPKIFIRRSVDIPAAIPYIRVHQTNVDEWRRHLKPGAVNIGLVWASSAVDPRRNLPIDRCGSWFHHPELHFVSLQKGKAANQIEQLGNAASSAANLDPHLHNFLDTACAMACLDLVISVDTAPLHLAGAMGVPLWVPLPFSADWRWPLDGTSSQWYPQATVFKQKSPGHWDDVIESIGSRLKALRF